MINGTYFLLGIITIILYDFGIDVINSYFKKKHNHIDIEVIHGKLYINDSPVENLNITIKE